MEMLPREIKWDVHMAIYPGPVHMFKSYRLGNIHETRTRQAYVEFPMDDDKARALLAVLFRDQPEYLDMAHTIKHHPGSITTVENKNETRLFTIRPAGSPASW